MDAISTAITSIFGFMGDAFTQMTSNPVLAIFLGSSVIGVAIGVFGRLRSVA